MAEETPTPAEVPTPTPSSDAAPAADAQQPASHSGKLTMAVKIYSPFQVHYEGESYSVSAVNATGPFDILPHHHNFLCMLVPSSIKVQAIDGSERVIKINRALMHVKADRVVVFVDV